MDERPPTLLARALRSLRYRGAGRTARVGWAWAAYHARHGARAPRRHAFDLEYGLDTTSIHRGGQLASGAGDGASGHEPVDPVDFHRLLTTAALPWRELTFVDLGSGQGRALLLASDFPFRRILGVELSRELHESAVANLACYRSPRQRCHAIASVWADAADWTPPEEDCVFYLYEPFDAALMTTLARRLGEWQRHSGRRGYVLYLGDRYRTLWDGDGGVERLAEGSGFAVYRLGRQ